MMKFKNSIMKNAVAILALAALVCDRLLFNAYPALDYELDKTRFAI
jgi:hypothetical protein